MYLSAAINPDLDASELPEIESQQRESFTDMSQLFTGNDLIPGECFYRHNASVYEEFICPLHL